MKRASTLLSVLLLVVMGALPEAASANLITNGDFSSNFDDWEGTINRFLGGPTPTTEPVSPPLETSPSFSSAGQMATLSTDLGTGIVGVNLFRTLDLTSFAAGTPLELSFDLIGVTGFASASLQYGSTSLTLDLNNPTRDISDAASHLATLSFGILAFPGGSNSNLTIDNVSLTQVAVPEPGLLALFACGLLLIGTGEWHRRVRSRGVGS